MSPIRPSLNEANMAPIDPAIPKGNTAIPSELELHDGISAPSYTSEQPKEISASSTEPDHIGVPDGGRRAWLVVLGGFINFTIAFGV